MYVSFSGGKDSTVLLDIVKEMYPDVPAVFIDTGLEYPEVRRFAIERADVVLRPEMRFDQVIKAYGYPVVSKEVAQVVREARKGLAKGDGTYAFRIAKLRGELKDKDGNLSIYNIPQWGKLLDADFDISEQCCTTMKKQPATQYEKETGRKPIIGTMADESFLRRNRWMRHGCNAFRDKRPCSNPLSFWLQQDILKYIKLHGLEIPGVYGEIVECDQLQGQTSMFPDQCGKLTTTGVSRTGCVFCAFGAHCEKAPNRFQRLKETHPRQYAYCIGGGEYNDDKWQPNKEGLGLGHVLDFIGVPYE